MWAITPKSLLTADEQPLITDHFLQLNAEDRRLRFGLVVSDRFIVQYVNMALADPHSEMFVIFDRDCVAAVGHVAVANREGELGVSVLPSYRGSGMASALFDRAVSYLRMHNAVTVYMHCLKENRVMQHIAQKNNMQILTEQDESDARLAIPGPTPLTMYQETRANRIAVIDMLTRYHAKVFMKLWGLA
jgi:RimJ/RimL family protein N-acetyltransferase